MLPFTMTQPMRQFFLLAIMSQLLCRDVPMNTYHETAIRRVGVKQVMFSR